VIFVPYVATLGQTNLIGRNLPVTLIL